MLRGAYCCFSHIILPSHGFTVGESNLKLAIYHMEKLNYFNFIHWTHEYQLTHWGPVRLIFASKITIITWHNCVSPCRRQGSISGNRGLFLIVPMGRKFPLMLLQIDTFSKTKWFWKYRVQNGRYLVWAWMSSLRPRINTHEPLCIMAIYQ